MDATIDFRDDATTRLFVSVEAGRLLIGRVGLFIRGGTQAIGPRQLDYTLEAGVRYLFRLGTKAPPPSPSPRPQASLARFSFGGDGGRGPPRPPQQAGIPSAANDQSGRLALGRGGPRPPPRPRTASSPRPAADCSVAAGRALSEPARSEARALKARREGRLTGRLSLRPELSRAALLFRPTIPSLAAKAEGTTDRSPPLPPPGEEPSGAEPGL